MIPKGLIKPELLKKFRINTENVSENINTKYKGLPLPLFKVNYFFMVSSASTAQAVKPVFLSYGQTPTAAVIRFQALHRE